MGRQRISWDMEKAASMSKQADPYTMNQDHKNNPIEKYKSYDTSTGKEDPDTRTPWKNEGRTETGHPAPAKEAREAVVSANVMQDKALKCITIASRMLPGASDNLIEDQATDLMYLPEHSVLATLQRQSRLAEVLAGCKDEEDADAEAGKSKKDEDEADAEAAKAKADPAQMTPEPAKKPDAKEAAKKEPVVPPAEEKKEDLEAGKKAPVVPPAEEKKEDLEAGKKAPVVPPAEEKKEDLEAGKKAPVVPPAEEKKEDVEAKSDGDLLDLIFAQDEAKTGAKKLSGIVKQASADTSLDNLWDAPPDVSKAFR